MSPETLSERDSRLEALKAVVGQMAHDFNNFLVPILGYIALIQEEAGQQFHGIEYLRKMESSARRVEGALSAMLMATRPQRRFDPKPTDFTKLIQDTVEDWSAALPAHSALTIVTELSPCSLVVDSGHWRLAIEHLLTNARFASAGGGELRLTLSAETLSPETAAALDLPRDVYRLALRDSGVGMPLSVLRRAFEPFFTTRRKGQALGLGLTIVHSIVRLHRGQILLESVEDEGATVTIWLPASDRGVRIDPAPAAVATPQRGPKIVLAGCDEFTNQAIEAYLRRVPIQIVPATNTAEVLSLCARNDPPKLVVADSSVLDGNAALLAEQLRQLKTKPALIVLAPAGADPNATGFTAAEPFIVLRRPFALKTLRAAIQEKL